MSAARRRIVRPPSPSHADMRHQHRRDKLRERLNQERRLLARWWVRLKRAFHAIEKRSACIARIERQLRVLEAS